MQAISAIHVTGLDEAKFVYFYENIFNFGFAGAEVSALVEYLRQQRDEFGDTPVGVTFLPTRDPVMGAIAFEDGVFTHITSRTDRELHYDTKSHVLTCDLGASRRFAYQLLAVIANVASDCWGYYDPTVIVDVVYDV